MGVRSKRHARGSPHLRRTVAGALALSIVVAAVVALAVNRKPILMWIAGGRYRPRVPAETLVSRDIEYSVSHGRSMRLDIYTPGSGGPHPLIVWLHSGAWRTLDKSCIEQGAMDQLYRGYALASVDYSLSFEQKWPAQLEQIRAALRWLSASSSAYALDRTRMILWGMSAGGHLASVVGTSADLDDDDRPYTIRAVIAWCAPSDLSGLRGGAYASAKRLLGYEPEIDNDKQTPANPMRYISPDDPPFYILHGGEDSVVPVAHALRFKSELESGGIPVAFRQMDGYAHEDRRFNAEVCMADVRRFLDEVCLGNVR